MSEGAKEQTAIIVVVVLGLLFLLWILLTFLEKLLGLALVVLGVMILIGFPDTGGGSYQTKKFWAAGKLIAIIMLLAGVALLIFG